jgi:beta-lactam-binding protein with PASTA domain
MLHRLSWLAVLVVLLFDTLCGSVAARSATLGPLVTVSPQQGRPGTTVRVTPTLTTPSECTAAWDSDPPVTFSCGPEPKADNLLQWTTLTVPEGAFPGPHTITVCSPGCGGVEPAWEQSAPFTVLAVVPDLVKPALGIDSAREVLKEAGLTLGAINGRSGDPAARITAQDPGPGTLVDPNSAVNVTVEVPQTTVTVPNLQGLGIDSARGALKDKGLSLGNITGRSGDPAARITAQDPAPGTLVDPNSAVNVTVEVPQTTVTVPNLQGLTQARADALVRRDGLALQVTSGSGRVESQDPPPGSSVPTGTTVNVVLRAGQPVVFVTVPDLRGKSLDEARANAEGAGLVVQVSGSAQNGFVDRQNPAPRTRVQRGSTVTVSLQVLVPRSSRRVPSSVWGVVAVAALAAAAVATWLIRRLRMRSAKWARDHIRVTADADAGQISLAQTSPTPTRTFWLEPHANAGLQTLEELRR